MLSLASFRYRDVFEPDGGPIERIVTAEFPVFGRRLWQANAFLRPGLVPLRRLAMYCNCNGTGAHQSPMVARQMAVSEALERWAFHSTVRSVSCSEFGFDVDESSNGMAAFPGFSRRPARQAAVFEAYERFCLLHWWERKIDGVVCATEWPGVTALRFEPAPGVVAVLLFARSASGFHVYGHSASASFLKACRRALLELIRNEIVVRYGCVVAKRSWGERLTDRFEQRAWFFSTDEGHELIQARLAERVRDIPSIPEVICDREIVGPWSEYATIWRFAFRPPSKRFLTDDERYFFW